MSSPEGPLHVLFVEDAEVDVELAVLELRRDGIDVRWTRVEVEEDLRRCLVENRPQIVLSDYSMPRFDGLSALRIVREMAPDLPFIFMSGTIGEERAIESIRNGATDYILKSSIRRLAVAVRRALAEAESRRQAHLAAEERARLAAILEATSDFVAMCNPQGELIYVNTATRRLLGLADGPLSGRYVHDLHTAKAWERISSEALPGAVREGPWQGESVMRARDGTDIPVSEVIIAHRDADGTVQYVSVIARDIRDRKAYEERIAYLANYDALTGLPNRALLADRVAQATAYRRRSDRSLALLVIDIDRFKFVNDGYDQATGDALLRQTGERLRGVLRDGDTVARLGADSFAILAADLAHSDDVLNIVTKIRDALGKPFDLSGREVHITVSIGASVYPRDGGDFDSLLGSADVALHRVKAGGQNSFQFYAAEMTREVTERVDLEQALRIAISRNELDLHFQPQINLETGGTVGLEALLRWNHPTRGSVSPGVFIPIAEHSDLIFRLGDWALAQAGRQLAAWGAAAADVRIAVNVSARQFRARDFPETVARMLELTGLGPARLELELTESVLVEDAKGVVRTLERLKELGVLISIDDFGTGYSSLSYLSRLPIDCLKIDRSFVHRYSEEQQDTEIIRAIISLAGSLEMRVIAEGVETPEQLQFLRSQGCDEVQGFLIARPMPAAAALQFIETGGAEFGSGGRGGRGRKK